MTLLPSSGQPAGDEDFSVGRAHRLEQFRALIQGEKGSFDKLLLEHLHRASFYSLGEAEGREYWGLLIPTRHRWILPSLDRLANSLDATGLMMPENTQPAYDGVEDCLLLPVDAMRLNRMFTGQNYPPISPSPLPFEEAGEIPFSFEPGPVLEKMAIAPLLGGWRNDKTRIEDETGQNYDLRLKVKALSEPARLRASLSLGQQLLEEAGYPSRKLRASFLDGRLKLKESDFARFEELVQKEAKRQGFSQGEEPILQGR